MTCTAPDHHGILIKQMQWIPSFFTDIYNELSNISGAAGVRERWLQGQMYLHVLDNGKDIELEKSLPVKTPKGEPPKSQKFDIVLDGKLAIELKIIGISHQTKMFDIFKKDFQRLISITDEIYSSGKYVMLVLVKDDESKLNNNLHEKLKNFSDSAIVKPYFEHDYGYFSVKVWKIINDN